MTNGIPVCCVCNEPDGQIYIHCLCSCHDDKLLIVSLNAIAQEFKSDPEKAHGRAESVLLSWLRTIGRGRVAEAYEKCRDDVGFFYA